MGPPERFSGEAWMDEIALNLHSVVFGSQAAAKKMIEQGHGGGSIINISSKAGSSGQTTMVGYGAAKAAVNNMTEGLANSWARYNIAVNVVAPGLTATPGLKAAGWIPDGAFSLHFPTLDYCPPANTLHKAAMRLTCHSA